MPAQGVQEQEREREDSGNARGEESKVSTSRTENEEGRERERDPTEECQEGGRSRGQGAAMMEEVGRDSAVINEREGACGCEASAMLNEPAC